MSKAAKHVTTTLSTQPTHMKIRNIKDISYIVLSIFYFVELDHNYVSLTVYQMKKLDEKDYQAVHYSRVLSTCFLLNPSWSKRLKRDYREEHLGLINYDVTQNMAGYELTTSFTSPIHFVSVYLYLYFDTTGAQSQRGDYVLICFC